jgi:hypothetical protein
MNMMPRTFVVAEQHDRHVQLYRIFEHASVMHDVRAAILKAEKERWGYWYVTWKQAARASLRRAQALRLGMEYA